MRIRCEQGQSLVELALVMPMLVLLLAGVVDLGGAFGTLISVVNSSREGARYGARTRLTRPECGPLRLRRRR